MQDKSSQNGAENITDSNIETSSKSFAPKKRNRRRRGDSCKLKLRQDI